MTKRRRNRILVRNKKINKVRTGRDRKGGGEEGNRRIGRGRSTKRRKEGRRERGDRRMKKGERRRGGMAVKRNGDE